MKSAAWGTLTPLACSLGCLNFVMRPMLMLMIAVEACSSRSSIHTWRWPMVSVSTDRCCRTRPSAKRSGAASAGSGVGTSLKK